MKRSVWLLFLAISLLPVFSGCGHKTAVLQSVTEDTLLGDWYTIKGDVEAYSLLKDDNSYIFTGTQGMRPVVYGTWKIENDSFIIIMDNGTRTAYSFILENDTLVFNKGAESYTRTQPFKVKHPEVRILLNITSDFTDMHFSPPRHAEVKWEFPGDNADASKEISAGGFCITGATVLSSGLLSDLGNYIRDNGYEADTLIMSEICNGYWDSGHLVTLCTSQDPEADNDSVFVTVSTAIVIK